MSNENNVAKCFGVKSQFRFIFILACLRKYEISKTDICFDNRPFWSESDYQSGKNVRGPRVFRKHKNMSICKLKTCKNVIIMKWNVCKLYLFWSTVVYYCRCWLNSHQLNSPMKTIRRRVLTRSASPACIYMI